MGSLFRLGAERRFDQWHPPLPPFGWYAAEQCVEADVHQILASTVASIQDPAIDASQACDVTDLQVYADFAQTLALQARDACVAHLSCNGAPAGCDIDPTTPETDLTNGPSNFGLFHDEGVRLELVELPALGRGLQLSGLDRDEASASLLTALGLANGDVLSHVDGASILGTTTIERLLLELPTTASWSVTVRRPTGSTWQTLAVTLTRGP